jgi:leader peptidase (prepilin peptidase) / N-methyltransferase
MVALITLAGFAVGSVIAALLDRLYTGAPLRGPILPCARCGTPAPKAALLGTVGWLMLRGRCPTCGARLPSRLFYLPLAGAAAFGVAAALADGRHLLYALLFLPSLLALTGTDIDRRLLPNRVLYPSIALAVGLCWFLPGREPRDVLLAGGIGFGVMFLLFMVMPGFGFGDVRLAGLLGLLSGLANVLPALFVAAIAAGVVSIVLLLTRRTKAGSYVPYGPYLVLGALWGMLAGGGTVR